MTGEISSGELADMVQMGTLGKEPELANPDQLLEVAGLALAQALDRRDERAIEDAQQRVDDIRAAHPELRNNQAS